MLSKYFSNQEANYKPSKKVLEMWLSSRKTTINNTSAISRLLGSKNIPLIKIKERNRTFFLKHIHLNKNYAMMKQRIKKFIK